MPTTNPLDYTGGYDFDDLVTDLTNRLKAEGTWLDIYESATGQMLIEFYAYIANMVLYYLERRAEECYIATAQNKSSVVNLVRLLNYTPQRKISSTGTLQFSVSTAAPKRIFIPQYTECQTANELKFLTIRDTTVEPGQTSNTITAIQGLLINQSVTGDGTADQEYVIDDTSIENDNHSELAPFNSFRVTVDGIEWEKVTSFLNSVNTSNHYILRAEKDDTITVVFGDDIKGKAPEVGAAIIVRYIRSDGSSGNVYSTGSVTTLNDTVYDEDSDAATVTVTNTSNMTGGAAAEGIEEIKAEAPAVFATGDRAVTKADFRAIIINYGSVSDVNVWGEAEESAPNYDMYNTVRICILLDGWYLPSASFKTTLSTDLYTQSMITVKYEYIEADILYIIPVLEAYIVAGNALTQAQSDIEAALAAEFVLGTTARLGISKYHSNLVDAVDSLDSVSYHHLTLEIRQVLSDSYDSSSSYGALLGADPILEESVKIYNGSNQIAVDDGLGAFTDLSSGYSVSGTINYISGEVLIDISPAPGGIISARYQQDASGDIVVDNDQVTKLYDTEFTTIAYVS